MSFADLSRAAQTVQPQGKKGPRQRNQKVAVEASIGHGKRISAFLERIYGPATAHGLLQKVAARANGSQPSRASDPNIDEEESDDCDAGPSKKIMPYGFWRRYVENEMRLEWSKRTMVMLGRALSFYVQRKESGAITHVALLGMRAVNSCRSDGGSKNSEKAGGVGFALLQFFVDYVQRLKSRSDACMLLKKARELRGQLVHEGWIDKDLPKLIGNPGACWFKRWRRRYGIVKKVTGMKLKVPWQKVKKRIRVFLGNIFRLRAFWELCHPVTPMRFLSLDQKPSWFNNAGHCGTYAKKGGCQPTVREDFNQTRERYSILTAVQSWGHTDPDVPPKVAILFRAKPEGTVIKRLRQASHLKPWMKVQVQEHGSYKSVDMVEALDWMLPTAADSTESIVVMLDWYSGHLTAEVAATVRGKGHVLMFHGGGCTPFTQINDTHLHASLARVLIQIENEWAQIERLRLRDIGLNKTPKMTRDAIISIVQTAWLYIDHERVTEKGYRQTGPTMPLRGIVTPEDVFGDLWQVMEELDASPDPTKVSMTLRDEAVAYVKEGWDSGKWITWADAPRLIEEHDGEGEGTAEGLEAFGTDACDTEDEDTDELDGDDSDEEDGDEGAAGAAGTDPSAGALADADVHDDLDDDDDADGDDGVDGDVGGGGGMGGASAVGGEESDRLKRLAKARLIVYNEALRTRDDVMLRKMRTHMREQTLVEKVASSKEGVLLVRRGREHRAAEVKLRQEALEVERLAANNLAETKLAIVKSQEAAAERRHQHMRLVIVNRREAQKTKRAEVLQKVWLGWLQLKYPVTLAYNCINYFKKKSEKDKEIYVKEIETCMSEGVFRRQVMLHDLWEGNRNLTKEWCSLQSVTTGDSRKVTCGRYFEEMLRDVVPPQCFGNDAIETLYRLFAKCVPCARKIFIGSYTPRRLLHVNDYSLEKAFVYGMIALSKWLGQAQFPPGVYGSWPPKLPVEFVTDPSLTMPEDIVEPPPLPPPVNDALDDAPPHIRKRGAASGSKPLHVKKPCT